MKVKTTLLVIFGLLLGSYQASAQCDGATFQEENGIVVMEAESVSLTSSWRQQSSFSGSTGNGYINWTGTQYFGSPGNGIIQYKIRINSPGTYRFNWRSRIGIGNNNTEHNDTWVKFPDAADFYGEKGGQRIYPVGSGKGPNPEGASSGGWFKVYMNALNWSWSAFTSDFDGHVIFARFDSPGVYTIQLSARSRGHLIDRMILYKTNLYSASSAQNLSRAETRCGGSTPPPPPPPPSDGGSNNSPSVSISSPTNGQNITAGSNVTIALSANDSDGSIAQHRIFVNGSLVDTDGSSYSPHIITNIAPGSYAVRAVVTDNDGATSEATVNFTVGGTSPPPPPDDGGDSSGGNNAPTVSITSPSNGQNITAGSNVSIGLSANDSDGSIVQHRIFVNGSLVDTDATFFTPHVILNIAPGSYAIRAVVTDNEGATGEATINFTVGGTAPPPPPAGGGDSSGGNNAPTVSITSPSNGQNITAGSNVSIGLSANDSDGSIVQHRIFVNGSLVDTDLAFFTPHIIVNIATGSYAVRAVVTDNEGATGEATINFTVGGTAPPPPPAGGGSNENNNPSVSITNPDNGANFVPGSNVSVQLSANDSDGSVVEHRIFVNGILVDTDPAFFTPYVITNIASGNYTVRALVTDNEGATAESSVSFTVGGSSGKTEIETKAIVYPNPTPDGTITVNFPREMGSKIGYQLMSPAGQVIDTGVKENGLNAKSANLQLNSLQQSQQGIYYLTITDGAQSFTIPIVKK